MGCSFSLKEPSVKCKAVINNKYGGKYGSIKDVTDEKCVG